MNMNKQEFIVQKIRTQYTEKDSYVLYNFLFCGFSDFQ